MVTLVATKEEFESLLEKAGDKLVVVNFTAAWCGPCRMIAPVFERWAKEEYSDVVFLKVDVDENSEVAEEYDIKGMPTFVFIRNKARVGEPVVGASEAKVKAAIEENKPQ